MDEKLADKIARYREIERRGLLDRLSPEKQARWAEFKRREASGQLEPKRQQAVAEKQEPENITPLINKEIGATREFLGGASMGLVNLAAGATNIQAQALADITHGADLKTRAKGLATISANATPVGAIANAIINREQFKQGVQELKQERAQFREQNPTISTLAGMGGTLVGMVLPMGAATKAVGAGGKLLARVPKALQPAVEATAKEALTFGSYEGVKNTFENQNKIIDIGGGIKGFGKGSVIGGALGTTSRITGPLTQRAFSNLGGWKGTLAKGAVETAAEGAVLGTASAAAEGEMPTPQDIGSSVLAVGAMKAGAGAFQRALSLSRKATTAPKQEEIAEAAQRAEDLKQNREMKEAIGRKTERLTAEIEDLEAKKQDIKTTTTPQEMSDARAYVKMGEAKGQEQKAIEELKAQQGETEKSIKGMDKKIKENARDRKIYEDKKASLTDELNRIRGEIAGLEKGGAEVQKKAFNAPKEQALEENLARRRSLQEQATAIEKEIKTADKELTLYKDEERQLLKEKSALEKQHKKAQGEELAERIEGVKSDIEENVSGIKENRSERVRLEKELSDTKARIAEAKEGKAQIEKISATGTKEDITAAIEKAKDLARTIKEGVAEKINSLSEVISFYKEAESFLKKDREYLTSKIKEADTKITEHKRKISSLNKGRRFLEILMAKSRADKRKTLSLISKQQRALKREKRELGKTKEYLTAEGEAIYRGELRRNPNAPVEVSEQEAKAFAKENNVSEESAKWLIERAKQKEIKRSAKEDTSLTEKIKQLPRESIEQVRTTFDKYRPLRKEEELAEAVSGKKQKLSESSYETSTNAQTGAEAAEELKPLAELAKKHTAKRPHILEEVAVSLEANKRNEFISKRIKEIEAKPIEEMTLGERNELESLKREREINNEKINTYKDDAEVQEVSNAVYDLNQKALDMLYEMGRIDEDFYKELKANKKYVPSKAVKGEGESGVRSADGLINNALKEFTGKEPVYENAIVSSAENFNAIFKQLQKEKAKKEIIATLEKTGRVLEKESALPYKGGEVKYDRENQIVVWENGQPKIYNVPSDVAKALNPEIVKPTSTAGKVAKTIFGGYMKGFKALTTALSPGFVLANVSRDFLAAVSSKYGKSISPLDIAKSADEIRLGSELASLFGRVGGRNTLNMTEGLRALGTETDKAVKTITEAVNNSTPSGSVNETIMNGFITALTKTAGKAAKVSKKGIANTLEGLAYAGDMSEQATRFSVFKNALKNIAKDEATFNAWAKNPNSIPAEALAIARKEMREATLNFTRQMSPIVEGLNKYFIPYFKPAILGAMRGWEILTNPEIAPNAFKVISNVGILQGLINARITDEKKLEQLDDINNEIMGKNFTVLLDDGKTLNIPIAQELAPLINGVSLATEKIVRSLNGTDRDDMLREAAGSAQEFLTNYIPVAGSFTPSNFSPSFLKPILEQSINKNLFSKTPIETASMQNKPATERFSRKTSLTARVASNKLASIGVEFSPARIDHLIKSFASSTGKEFLPLADAALQFMGIGEDIIVPSKNAEDMPIVGRFFKASASAYSQTALDAMDAINYYKQYARETETSEDNPKFELNHDIWEEIKPLKDDLVKSYKAEQDLSAEMLEDGRVLFEKLKEGEITKAEFKRKKYLLSIQYAKEFKEINYDRQEIFREINKEVEDAKKAAKK